MDELVTGNRILAREGVVDSFGHISVRHPDNPQRYLLSRSRAPDCIEADDIMEFTLDGAPIDARGRAPYLERFIHGALYEARPDVMSVVHNHSESVILFGVTAARIKPIFHMGASIGHEVCRSGIPTTISRYGAAGREYGDGPRPGEAGSAPAAPR
jgi:HCOMODA/2-hydroxy-3-carboxy-muconic semialdehyde decarboxylase